MLQCRLHFLVDLYYYLVSLLLNIFDHFIAADLHIQCAVHDLVVPLFELRGPLLCPKVAPAAATIFQVSISFAVSLTQSRSIKIKQAYFFSIKTHMQVREKRNDCTVAYVIK